MTPATQKVLLLVVTGVPEDTILKVAEEKLGLDAAAARAAIAEARRQITLAADYNRDDELGTAYLRLNDLYTRAVKVQDLKTALAAQRELDKLLDLYPKAAPGDGTGPGQPDGTDTRADAEAAREHLAALNLTDAGAPLAEHARLAVSHIVELEAAAE